MPKLDSYKIDGFKIDGAMGGVRIKSIQTGTITISSVTSATATVTAVDLTKAILLYNGGLSDYTDIDDAACRLTLTNATTVTANRIGNSGSATVAFILIELEGLKSIQSGTIGIASGVSNTATVTAVNVNKAILIYNGFSTGFNSMKYAPHIVLTDATTITATRNESSIEHTYVGYMLVEFN